jgi:plastocyanin
MNFKILGLSLFSVLAVLILISSFGNVDFLQYGQPNILQVSWADTKNNTCDSNEMKNKFPLEISQICDVTSQNLVGIIAVTKTEHLDSDRQVISGVYDKVRDLDGIWSDVISDSHYIRATFEQNLDFNNDITIYPRIISGNPRIEIYEKDKTELVAEFSLIKSNQYNKVFLTGLQKRQNTFDLRVLGGSIEFDHIVDPWPAPTFVGAGTSTGNVNAITPSLPSNLQTNDILILFVETANQSIIISDQNGGTWTQITDSPQGTGTAGGTSATSLTAFWSRYDGVQGAPTTSDSGDHQLGRIFAFRGVIATGNPWDVTSGNIDATSDTSLSATGDTTTVGNTLVVIAAALNDDADDFGAAWANSNLANITVQSNTSTNTGNDGRLGVVTGEKITASAYGATTNTLTSASTKGMMTIALRPPLPVSPTLSISQPDGIGDTVNAGSSYNIAYTLSDLDDVVTAAFYYDINNSGLDGTAISGACTTAAEGTSVCSWDTTAMSHGIYYVYGITNDGTNPTVSAYSPGQITINTVPSAPTGLTASTISSSQINLSWTAPSNGGSPITGYKIERESPIGGGFSTIVADTGSTDTTYSNTGLNPNTQYNYRVSAINAIGTGDASNESAATTLLAPTAPSSPLNLSGSFDETNYTLSWDVPSSDGGSAITDYVIEYSPDASSWSTYNDGIGTATTATLTGLAVESYYFQVSAVNAVGTSLPSNQVHVIVSVSTTGTQDRNPPQIDGIGIFKINPLAESFETYTHEDQTTHFEKYFKYSTQSHTIDHELYGDNYVKTGQFFDKENFDKTQPTFLKSHDVMQIQIPILDEYQGSKIEHISLYFQDKSNKPNSETWISFDKPDAIQVSDPQKVFNKVNVSYSLEDGYFWAIFNIEFGKPLSSGVLIESWHESKNPTYEFVPDIINKDSKFSENQSKTEHIVKITMLESHTSSPTCSETQDCYIPYDAYVLEGGMVVWENADRDFIHTVTSGAPETGPDNKFNGVLMPGEIFHHIFGSEGNYPYYCMMHPWAEGMVIVLKEDALPPEKIHHSTGINVAGKVLVPIIEKFPLLVKSLSSGKISVINTNDVVYLESQNLKVELSGFVGTENPTANVKIQIIRPDKSEKFYNIPVNDDGEYHLLATLSEHWQAGDYQVTVFYGEIQIGNISFKVSDKKDGEFGGILPKAEGMMDYWLKFIEPSQFYNETESMGWYSLKIGEHGIFQITDIENTNTGQTIQSVNKSTEVISGYESALLIVMLSVGLTSIVGLISIYRNKNRS